MQMNSMSHEIEGSEDCLYLNVYTTAIQPTVKRAVMMWLYGGSFTYGSGNDSVYSPDHIIRHDVVLVTINYRLGVFGTILARLQHLLHYVIHVSTRIFLRFFSFLFFYLITLDDV